jgi:hypothetical protein
LRAAEVSEDVNDALTGHSGSGSVGRTYGSKTMVRRFGLPALAAAVNKVAYSGLDLSGLTYKSSDNAATAPEPRGAPNQRASNAEP